MKVYEVGGAVRDSLLGRPINDRDWVVVGATPEQMEKLGFIQVGKDFPVFLHPKTKEEYALARSERKVGPGYKGFQVSFDPSVSLSEDLARRDLTINAIAKAQDGGLIDPYGGQDDVQQRILRHVGMHFVEDPVRILRIARFSARLTDFRIAPETMQLMQQMVQQGETRYLVPERVWQELARGLMEAEPQRMFKVLQQCGLLEQLIPEIISQEGELSLQSLQQCVRQDLTLDCRWASLVYDLSLDVQRKIVSRLKLPKECSQMASCVARAFGFLQQNSQPWSAEQVLDFLLLCDSLRRGQRFENILKTLACIDEKYSALEQMLIPLNAGLCQLDLSQLVYETKDKTEIPEKIRLNRLTWLSATLHRI